MLRDVIGRTIIAGKRRPPGLHLPQHRLKENKTNWVPNSAIIKLKKTIIRLKNRIFRRVCDGFLARDTTFRNKYGPVSQAMALMSAYDRSAFYRCSIEDYQDTVSIFSQPQLHRERDMSGFVDIVFGKAAAAALHCDTFGIPHPIRRPSVVRPITVGGFLGPVALFNNGLIQY